MTAPRTAADVKLIKVSSGMYRAGHDSAIEVRKVARTGMHERGYRWALTVDGHRVGNYRHDDHWDLDSVKSAILRVGRCGDCGRRVTDLRGARCERCDRQRDNAKSAYANGAAAAARVERAYAVLRAARSAATESDAYEAVAKLLQGVS